MQKPNEKFLDDDFKNINFSQEIGKTENSFHESENIPNNSRNKSFNKSDLDQAQKANSEKKHVSGNNLKKILNQNSHNYFNR